MDVSFVVEWLEIERGGLFRKVICVSSSFDGGPSRAASMAFSLIKSDALLGDRAGLRLRETANEMVAGDCCYCKA